MKEEKEIGEVRNRNTLSEKNLGKNGREFDKREKKYKVKSKSLLFSFSFLIFSSRRGFVLKSWLFFF
jgi:hypothetical protein